MFKRKSTQQNNPPPPAQSAGRPSISSVASSAQPPHGPGIGERVMSFNSVETANSSNTVKGRRMSNFLGLGGGKKKEKGKGRDDEPDPNSRTSASFAINGRNSMNPSSNGSGLRQQVPIQQHQNMNQRQTLAGPVQMQQQPGPGSDFGPGRPPQHQRGNSLGPQSSLRPADDRGNQPLSPNLNVPIPSGGGAVAAYPMTPTPEWRQQFESIFELFTYQPLKTYVASPPELEMIFARTSANQVPKQGIPGSPGNDWDAVWLQLSGTSLSMWSMKETRAAAAQGTKVPPMYFNITESSVELFNPLPPPPHRPQSRPHNYIFSLNTAGANQLLFSCPEHQDLVRWANGLRLAAWERSRLEEIYTGHLIRAGRREPASPLQRGRFEGWVRVRPMGSTDWQRLWLVVNEPSAAAVDDSSTNSRRHSIFGIGKVEQSVQEPNTGVSMASFYSEPRTAKNRTTSLPVLTITNVTQAYATFPERLEVMTQNNIMKVVGRISGKAVVIERSLRDSGWVLIMPEQPEEDMQLSPLVPMLRWITAFHDAFQLYGRGGPTGYTWNTADPASLFFAYPHGELRGDLFLTMDDAVKANWKLNTPGIRNAFSALTQRAMQERSRPDDSRITEEEEESGPSGTSPGAVAAGTIGGAAAGAALAGTSSTKGEDKDFRLPPLQLGREGDNDLSLGTMSDSERAGYSGPPPPPRTHSRNSVSPPLAGPGPQTLHSAGQQSYAPGTQTLQTHTGLVAGPIAAAASQSKPGSQPGPIDQDASQRTTPADQNRPGSASSLYTGPRHLQPRPGSSGGLYEDRNQQQQQQRPGALYNDASQQSSRVSSPLAQSHGPSVGVLAGRAQGGSSHDSPYEQPQPSPNFAPQQNSTGQPESTARQGIVDGPDGVRQNSFGVPEPREDAFGVPDSPMRQNSFGVQDAGRVSPFPPPQQQRPPQSTIAGVQSSLAQQGAISTGSSSPFQHAPQSQFQQQQTSFAGPQGSYYSQDDQRRTPLQQQPFGQQQEPIQHHRQTLQALGVTPDRGDSPSQLHGEPARGPGAAQPPTPQTASSLPPRRASYGADLQGAQTPQNQATSPIEAHGGQGKGASGFAAVGAGVAGAAATAAAIHTVHQHQRNNNNTAPHIANTATAPTNNFNTAQTALPPSSSPAEAYQPYQSPPLSASAGAQPVASPVSSPVATHSKASSPRQSDTLHQPRPQRSSGMSNEASSPALSPNLRDEPAALYLMNMVEEPDQAHPDAPSSQSRQIGRGPGSLDLQQPNSPPTYQSQAQQGHNTVSPYSVGRRPSGARAIPPSNHSNMSGEPISPVSPHRSENGRSHFDGPLQRQQQQRSPQQQNGTGRGVATAAAATTALAAAAGAGAANGRNQQPIRENPDDDDADAAAYLAYADAPVPQTSQPPKAPIREAEGRSSFAPSKLASERRANAEAAAQRQQHTMNVPGGGRRKDSSRQHRGDFSPDDESDEDEDEDEDEQDPASSPPGPPQQRRQGNYNPPPGSFRGDQQQQQQQSNYQQQQYNPQQQMQQQQRQFQQQQQQYQQQRGPLPPVPRGQQQSMYGDELAPPSTLRGMSIHDGPDRSRSNSPPAPHRHLPHPSMPPQLAAGVAPAAKHNVWNANFTQEHGLPKKDGKFVELEEPSVQLTKAFTPGGLLQAGYQDKADRSARRQEEVARETGSSLLNIPEKPPPPSTGLVGAVAAHERDRKNAGGIGATLTDRDRERRLAEDRQRKIEELQRQQMDTMSQYGGGFGAPYPQFGYGMPPQMMGMGGYPQYGGGMMNPQAQQQAMMAAQMAYQQTIVAMSQAGSQMGDHDVASVAGGRSPSPANSMRMPGMPGAPPMGMFPGGGGYGYGMPPPSMYGFPMGMPPMGMYPGQQPGGGQPSPGNYGGRPGSMMSGNSPMHTGGAGSYNGGDRNDRDAS